MMCIRAAYLQPPIFITQSIIFSKIWWSCESGWLVYVCGSHLCVCNRYGFFQIECMTFVFHLIWSSRRDNYLVFDLYFSEGHV
jgi:hypothetical protein